MGKAQFGGETYAKRTVLALALTLALFSLPWASAQDDPCHGGEEFEPDNPVACPDKIPLDQGSFHATPLMDGNTSLHYPHLVTGPEIVTLYGQYGNDETSDPAGQQHFQEGVNRAMSIQPLALNGTPNLVGGSIVFLFIGFSNCTIEICGGNWNIWNGQDPNITGQPCSTNCNNPKKTQQSGYKAWDEISGEPPVHSFLYQVYSPSPHLVGPHVYVFDGAAGKQTLDKWDTTGYYLHHGCIYNGLPLVDPECDYDRAQRDLENNGFSENQVQVIFIKTANSYPNCDLSGEHCLDGITVPDAYQAEQQLGNILRYLKCCKYDGTPRYPHLQQVFITSRIYGGYAKNPPHGGTAGCLNPEPYAYEEGFSVQRIIVSQIKQQYGPGSNDQYSGPVDYDHAPWFDWGPYLWADGPNVSPSSGVFWCNGQSGQPCFGARDVRDGDIFGDHDTYWGDYTHPSAQGTEKVANQLVKFIKPTAQGGSPFVQPWVQK